jgi:hypothetical protein
VEAVQVVHQARREVLQQPIQVVEAVEAVTRVQGLEQVAQAVQALSFFATPAQFNISLVAQ